MKKYLVTFPIKTGKKKRLITTYRGTEDGQQLRIQHQNDLVHLEQSYVLNSDHSFAYTKTKSIKFLVEKHLSNNYFYQFDISNFFGSIDHNLLEQMLVNTDQQFNNRIIYQCSNAKKKGLALGLIPSPYLSNIYLTEFDNELAKNINSMGTNVVYTRYSDDLTISATTALDLEALTLVLNKLLGTLDLTINHQKTKVSHLETKGQHLKILGLNIIRGQESNYITVGRKFKTNTFYENNQVRKHAMQSYIDFNEQ